MASSGLTGLDSATIPSVGSTAKEYATSLEEVGQTSTEKSTVSSLAGLEDAVLREAKAAKQTSTEKSTVGSLTELEDATYGSRSVESQPDEPQLQSLSTLRSGTAFVQDCVSNQLSNLYTLDLSTGQATLVGAIATEVTDIAFVGSELYGLEHESGSPTVRLVRIDPATGKATAIGNTGFFITGLAYNRHRDTLYASSAKHLIAIDIKTGAGKSLLTVARQDYNCGEVAFDRNGKAYITLIGYDRKKLLATCDLYSAAINIIGDIGFPGLGSMEFYGDTLYGVTGNFFELGSDGQLIRIDTTTGAGTLVATTDPIGRWAGISFYETDSLSRT